MPVYENRQDTVYNVLVKSCGELTKPQDIFCYFNSSEPR
jgi:hypothetical protein